MVLIGLEVEVLLRETQLRVECVCVCVLVGAGPIQVFASRLQAIGRRDEAINSTVLDFKP